MGASLESQPSMTAKSGGAAAAGLGPGERDTVAGRYKLLELIAEGGMGAVYRAEHLLSRKKLAVKVVHPYLCKGRQGVERFRREVSAAAEIDHPGIVQVYDAGVDEDGGFFMAMELLEGESLGDLLRRDWPGMATSVRIVVGMLEPLAKAHAKGFVHRDLKPDNIFLAKTEEGKERVKIVDFGLAREVSKGGPTRTGITFGTPEYMSPEQAMSARQVRPPGDVWSIGVMLYELLSGQHPFSGETPNAIMANAIKEALPPIRAVAPHVPEPLARFIARCLEKKPDARPESAGAMLEELRAVLAEVKLDETVPNAPTPPAVWNESQDTSDPEIDVGPVASIAPSIAIEPPTPSEVAAHAAISKSGRRGLLIGIGASVALVVVAAAGMGIFFALQGDDEAPAREVATRAEPPPPEPAAEAPVARIVPEPEVAPVAAPEPVIETPEPVRAPTKRRPAASAIPEESGPTALEEARTCLARGDRQCARDILAARGRSAEERALLIDTYRDLGNFPQMLDAMESFVRRFPRAAQTERYRADLRRYGRLN